MPPFFFWDLRLSLLSLLWFLFQVDCLSLLHLVVFAVLYCFFIWDIFLFSVCLIFVIFYDYSFFQQPAGCSSSRFCLSYGEWGCLWGLVGVSVGRDVPTIVGGDASFILYCRQGLAWGYVYYQGSSLFRNTLSCLSTAGCVFAQLVVWPGGIPALELQAIGWGQVLVRNGNPCQWILRTSAASVPALTVSHSCPLCLQGTLQY